MEPFLWDTLWDENLMEHTGNYWLNIFFLNLTHLGILSVFRVWVAFQKRVSTFPELKLQMVVSHPSHECCEFNLGICKNSKCS